MKVLYINNNTGVKEEFINQGMLETDEWHECEKGVHIHTIFQHPRQAEVWIEVCQQEVEQ